MRWTLAWPLVAVACHNSPKPCVAHDACDAGQECIANLCVVEGSDPVPPRSTRYVLSPSASGIVSSQHPSAATGLPALASLGSRATGPVAWYLDFTPSWPETSRIDQAFLVLSPPPGAPYPSSDVDLETWRVSEPWRIQELAWSNQPARDPPHAEGIASASPPRPARIDVTHIVRYWQHHPYDRHGLAIEARSGSGHGVSFETGAGGGRPPQLEVYVTEQ